MAATIPNSSPSAAESIMQLSKIDSDVAELLRSAGMAIKTLACTESEADGEDNENQSQTIEDRQQNFTTASSRYFSLLSSIDVRLRRQISALEDAEIIPSETVARDPQSSRDAPPANVSMSNGLIPRPGVSGRDSITNGGMGNLDVGWLNSRNNNVGRAMEANLWKEAHELLQTTLETKNKSDVAMSDNATTSSVQP